MNPMNPFSLRSSKLFLLLAHCFPPYYDACGELEVNYATQEEKFDFPTNAVYINHLRSHIVRAQRTVTRRLS